MDEDGGTVGIIEEIARVIFATAVEQAPHAEWEHQWWDDMTDKEKSPFIEAARRVAEKNIDVAVLYLWTRDGSMPVNQKTEDYVKTQLEVINSIDSFPVYSDSDRLKMVKRILNLE